MISREKLEEMVSKDKKVYWHRVDNNSYYIIRFDTFKFLPEWLEVCDYFEGLWRFDYNDLITKEEYEWGCEFQNIKRTETLNLPSWEEFCKITEKQPVTEIANFDNYHFKYAKEKDFSCIGIEKGCKTLYYNQTITPETYRYACKIAKKLFLGEDLGDEKAD